MPNYPQYMYPAYPQYPYSMQQSGQAQSQNQNQGQNQNMPSAQSMAMQPPIRNNGFIVVATEEDAYKYPVAYGNCVTCKVENEPIVIEKSMSFSQLDNPRIDRYRLVREDIVESPKAIEEIEIEDSSSDELKAEIQALRHDIEDIKKKLFSQPKTSSRKRESDDE